MWWWLFFSKVFSILCFEGRDKRRIEAACIIQRAFRRRWRYRRETERLFYLTADTGGSIIGFGALW